MCVRVSKKSTVSEKSTRGGADPTLRDSLGHVAHKYGESPRQEENTGKKEREQGQEQKLKQKDSLVVENLLAHRYQGVV